MTFHTISGNVGSGGKRVLDFLVSRLSRLNINPNLLTFIGLGINIFATILFARGLFFWAGLVMLFGGMFDMLDGAVARVSKRVTRFGGFLDSVIDRYSDMLMLFGLLIWYAKIDQLFYVGLTGMAIIGSVMISYTRARAESLIPKCKVGFLERAERVVLLSLAALTDRMAVALWIMAILTNWTAIQRTWFTSRELNRIERAERKEVEDAGSEESNDSKIAPAGLL
jgi:CDP-diacylglycerol--glycerol-3-phosphate 3-phosphatidyltransferase